MAKRITGVTTKRLSDETTDGGMPLGEDTGRRRFRGENRGPQSGAKQEPTVNTPSAAWVAMQPKWQLIEDLRAGTAAMRAAGERHLPRHQYEADEAYAERLSRAVLKNYVSTTLEKLVGKAFKDPPVLAEKASPQINDFCEDVDGEGNALSVFARSWFREAVAKAFAWVLVDFTKAPPRPDGLPRTRADDERDRVRPFWRLIDSTDLIEVSGTTKGGELELTRVRIRECSVEQDGLWGEKIVHRVRVLYPGSYELWRLVKIVKGKETWELEEQGLMALDYIPLVPFYTAKDGLMEGKPHMEDLAYLNVEHWQSSSDQRSALTVARFPILAASGVTDAEGNSSGQPLVVGPKKFLTVPDPQGKVYYVEHTGAALESGRKDMDSIEDAMSSYGAQFLKQKTGDVTATGRALDGAEAISELQAWGLDFKDAMERALQVTCDWLKIEAEGDAGPEVEFEVGAEVAAGDSAELDALVKVRATKDISRNTLLAEFQRRGVLSEDFDAEQDQADLDAEPPPPGGLEGLMPGANGLPSQKQKTPAQTPATPPAKKKSEPKEPPIEE